MKIVVPVMPKNLADVEAIDPERLADADIIEWRADFLPKEEILKVAPAVFEKFVGRELIFTIRTSREGGHIELTD
ncbi:type I 3-dehydroquinate dehydratase, partial [Streptococcus pyogenes]